MLGGKMLTCLRGEDYTRRNLHHWAAPQNRELAIQHLTMVAESFNVWCLSVWPLPFTSIEMSCIQSWKVIWVTIKVLYKGVHVPQLLQTHYDCGHDQCFDLPYDSVQSTYQGSLAFPSCQLAYPQSEYHTVYIEQATNHIRSAPETYC